MRLYIAITCIVFFSPQSAFAQSKGDNKAVKAPTAKILCDTFKGKIPGANKYYTRLILQHCRYCDDGKFALQETMGEARAGDKSRETNGEWTVLKGDAADDNATVVEIDAKQDTLYFLRLKNGDLQKLDARLKEIKPAATYIFKKR